MDRVWHGRPARHLVCDLVAARSNDEIGSGLSIQLCNDAFKLKCCVDRLNPQPKAAFVSDGFAQFPSA